MHNLKQYIKGEVLDLTVSDFTEEYSKEEAVVSVLAITSEPVVVNIESDKIKTAHMKLPEELAVNEQSATFDTIVTNQFWDDEMLVKIDLMLNPEGLFLGTTDAVLGEVTSKLHDHFSDVETWESEGLTVWKAKK